MPPGLILLCLHVQQGRGFGPEAEELLIGRVVVLRPTAGPVEAGERPRLVAKLPVRHGLEEEVEAVALAVAGGQAPLQGRDGFGVSAGTILGDAQRVEVFGAARDQLDGAARQVHRAPRVAAGACRVGQVPDVVVAAAGQPSSDARPTRFARRRGFQLTDHRLVESGIKALGQRERPEVDLEWG